MTLRHEQHWPFPHSLRALLLPSSSSSLCAFDRRLSGSGCAQTPSVTSRYPTWLADQPSAIQTSSSLLFSLFSSLNFAFLRFAATNRCSEAGKRTPRYLRPSTGALDRARSSIELFSVVSASEIGRKRRRCFRDFLQASSLLLSSHTAVLPAFKLSLRSPKFVQASPLPSVISSFLSLPSFAPLLTLAAAEQHKRPSPTSLSPQRPLPAPPIPPCPLARPHLPRLSLLLTTHHNGRRQRTRSQG
jgi:hypothetical protein